MPGDGKGLGWIEQFVSRISPFVHLRLRDRVLIRMPNETFKLNRTGARVLHHLLQGGTLKQVLDARPADPELEGQLVSFFTDLSRVLGKGICEGYHSRSLVRVPVELGYIELPILSEVALTRRCNIRCSFCYADCVQAPGRSEHEGAAELDTGQVKSILGIIRRDAQVPSVSFTGGEPTLRRDLTELIAYAHGVLGMRVNLITNGTRINREKARAYRDAGLASAQVSIESAVAEIHDGIVGVRGAFNASVEGLTALREAGVAVHPHATLCAANRSSLPRLAGLASRLGIPRFSANLVIPTGRGADADLAVKYSETGETLALVMASARAHRVKFMWYSPTPVCLFNPLVFGLGNKGCSACEGLLSVDPGGQLLPCSSWKQPLGNLLTEGFDRLWFASRARHLRAKGCAHPGCRGCADFALCHGACPLYFKIHGYDEIEAQLCARGLVQGTRGMTA